MSLTIYANTGSSDLEYGISGSEWVEVDTDNDEIIFSAGSSVVADGEAIPSSTQLNQAGTLLTGSEIEVAHAFLSDNSAGILKEIINFGSGNYRYVFAASLSDATASEPVLELWDDINMDSTDLVCLGSGTPASSFFRGICTTDALPGVGWTGSRLAGSGDGNFLYLNNEDGALSGADVLYFQLCIKIPASQTAAGAETPIMAIKYASAT